GINDGISDLKNHVSRAPFDVHSLTRDSITARSTAQVRATTTRYWGLTGRVWCASRWGRTSVGPTLHRTGRHRGAPGPGTEARKPNRYRSAGGPGYHRSPDRTVHRTTATKHYPLDHPGSDTRRRLVRQITQSQYRNAP